MPYLVDTYIGCSTKASEWMFPRTCIDSDSYYLLHNAIDLDLYDRNINLGLEVRQKFNIPKDALVVGHIVVLHLLKIILLLSIYLKRY